MISASSWRRWHYRDQKMSVLYKIYALDNRLCCQPWLFQLTFISKRHVTDVQLQWSMSIKSQRRCVTTSKQVYVMQMWLRLSLSIVNRSCKVNTVQAAWCEYLFSEFRPRFGFILKPHNGSHVIPYVLDAPSGGGERIEGYWLSWPDSELQTRDGPHSAERWTGGVFGPCAWDLPVIYASFTTPVWISEQCGLLQLSFDWEPGILRSWSWSGDKTANGNSYLKNPPRSSRVFVDPLCCQQSQIRKNGPFTHHSEAFNPAYAALWKQLSLLKSEVSPFSPGLEATAS